jgi:hypothetical protein
MILIDGEKVNFDKIKSFISLTRTGTEYYPRQGMIEKEEYLLDVTYEGGPDQSLQRRLIAICDSDNTSLRYAQELALAVGADVLQEHQKF